MRKYVGDQLIQVSIHTPTQGVTAITAYFTLTKSVSIHTPTQGVTILWTLSNAYDLVSIHTPTQGVTKKLKMLTK